MSDPAETPPSVPVPAPKRYFRRGKIEAYRDQFMLADGTPIDGERFNDIKRVVDYISARWYNADSGEELVDFALAKELEQKYQENVQQKRS